MAPRSPALSRIELLQGTLDMIILQSLCWGPRHGYGLVQHIRATSHGVLQVDAGSLYPALHRLEKQGWVSAEWKVSEKNQRAKYYQLTRAGKKQLLAAQSKWGLFVKAIAGVMNPAQ